MKKYLFYISEINGLEAVEETVRVIEKSAAAQIHFLKKSVQSLTMYKNQIQTTLQRLSRFYWNPNHPLLKIDMTGDKALLVITGEKGIVGGLYHDVVNEVVYKKSAYQHILIIGSKGKEYLKEEGIRTEELSRASAIEDVLTTEKINQISSDLFKMFQNLGLRNLDILYPCFLSLAKQQPAIIQFLPFDLARPSQSQVTSIGNKNVAGEPVAKVLADQQDGFPIFEPSKKFIFDILIKKYIDVFFAQIVLEAKLSELAARTVTAESAIKETEGLISSLNRASLKEKHRVITQKQVESFSVHQMA